MTIVCFYLVLPEIKVAMFPGVVSDTIKIEDGKEYTLYAFTPEKRSADYFRATRNMKIFYEKTIEIAREDYDEFCDDHKEYLLEYHPVITKILKHGVYHQTMIELLSTTVESDCILFYKNEYFIDIINRCLPDYIIKLVRANAFDHEFSKLLYEMFSFSSISYNIEPMEDCSLDDYEIDELALYIKLFSNTLKK